MSQYYEWSDSYIIDNGIIDEQHRKLCSIGAEIEELVNMKDLYSEEKYHEKILHCLAELIKYTIVHFKTEEEIMCKHNYKYIDQHRKLHEELIDKVSSIRQRYEDNSIDAELDGLLNSWLINHIFQEDVPIKGCL